MAVAHKFILDQIAASANSAYSTRRLSSKYNGPLMNIRRSSDSVAMDIYATPAGDLDTAALLAFVGSGTGFITKWYDQSGLGHDGVQVTAANQPFVVSSGVLQTRGIRPVVRFANVAGTPFYLNCFKFAAPSTNFTVNRIAAADNVVGNNANVLGTDTQNPFDVSGAYMNLASTSFNRAGNQVAVTGPTTPVNGVLFITTTTYTAANSAVTTTNGNAGSTFSAIVWTIGVLSVWQMGAYSLTTQLTNNLSGHMAEHITFPSTISAADEKNLEYSQAIYYGLTVKL